MNCLSFIKDLYGTPKSIIILIQIYNVLIGILNITGNAILIWALRRTRQTKTISFQFIAIMSASDFSIGIIGLIFITLLSFDPYQNYCWLKLTVQFALNACNYFSVCMVFLIALDRYLHMKYLERYSLKFTKKRGHFLVMLLLSFSVLISGILSLPLSHFTHSIIQIVYFCMSVFFLLSIIMLYWKALHEMRRKASQITRIIINHNKALSKAGKRISICILVLIAPIVIILLLDGVNENFRFFNSSDFKPFIWFAFITFLGNGFCSSVIFISQNIPIQRILRRIARQNWNRVQAAIGTHEASV